MTKVFMDGGSSLNIIFADTLRRMNKSVENLPKSASTFHGIVPGKAVLPEGTIQLDVTFGDPTHFRTKSIEFEVVDWTSQYHAILGRPLSPDSWPSRTTPTSSLKCQDQKELSRSTGTFKGQIHVTVTSAKSQRCMGWSNHSPNSRFLTTAHFCQSTRG